MTQLLQLIFIIAGASILGVKFDMDIGWSIGLLCVALMNWPEKRTKKKKPCNHKNKRRS
jgi:hypothetical protein